MNRKQRLELAHWAVDMARKQGADEASANISNSRDIEIQYRDGKLEQLKESTQNSLSLAIYANERYSSHSTNDIRKESLGKFVEEAVAMTRYLSQDPFRTLPDPKYYQGQKKIDLNLLDPNYGNVNSEQRVQISKEIEEASDAQSDKTISCTGGYGDTYSESVKVHSNGFEGERESTVYYAGGEATIDDGQGGRPADYYYSVVRHFKDLPDPKQLGREAVDRALTRIGQKKLPSGVFDMIVENRSVGRLFGALYGPMSGRSLQQRRSFLEGKLDQKILSEKMTVIDDPFIVGAMGSRLYDGEGMATQKRAIIEKGVLKSYFINNYYGNKLGVEPTGGGSTNITFAPGTRSMDEMIKGTENGILVTRFLGGNSNSTTGDFSYGVIGALIEGGKLVQPMNEMNISGNLLDLWAQLDEVGSDAYTQSSWRLPSLYFKDIQFSGE